MDVNAHFPEYEAERLKRVEALCPQNEQDDEVFEKMISMTSEYFNAPIALISIVDKHRQWFRARIGIEEHTTPRDVSFCAHSLRDRKPLEVLDARDDERFKDNPMVTGPPFIRYYASAPLLTSDGFSLGSLCIIDTSAREPMSKRDAGMLVYFAQLVVMRITSLRSRNFIDQPTGLFNRLRLEEDIRMASSSGIQHDLFAVDVISPKFLNDVVKALGYSFSQKLMLDVKTRLQSLLPKDYLLYKISPTRFGFLLKAGEPVEHLCLDILSNFCEPVDCQGIPIPMQPGIGVLKIADAEERDWLRLVVGAADDARVRNLGWTMYQPELDAAQQRAFVLLSSLPDAVRSGNQLSLVFQPKIRLPSLACESVEALIRWNHPTLGPISPAEFIPLAEKTALMHSITFWVLHAVVSQAKVWRSKGIELRISMNVTVSDLENSKFVNKITEYINDGALLPKNLELEFTESMHMSDPKAVITQLERARGLGIDISVDDFGTGYSNWTYLRQLPVSTVKLDQSLISNLDTNEKDKRLVKTLIELARGLGYRVVAEGVETKSILDLITPWGCSEAQGYLFTPPLKAKPLEEWLEQGGFNAAM
ncbi:EAL domain, c-di-GMP-specific phosphodiesterase class I (or its enzymatically inactive variant) [Pseudomonas simiae]|uniref:sensor domain-containing phosphodiesterase n=1 Tax=Pseudomonas simiae TaxID=321846 RepID=UPI00084D3F5B|nr:GGDEF and EAL domain-containing protein [Pseudomonas simiae]SFA82978.1 EAL domain, c-di-GMP-specific phosphodiesterase class I (or its enzymatically inactive variant) [Pseudomonas simiae]